MKLKKIKLFIYKLKYKIYKKDKYLKKILDFTIQKSNNIKNIQIFIPIGYRCHTAMQLNKLKLRKSSYPFDWIISKIKFFDMMSFCIDCIINNFDDFANFNDLSFEDNNNSNFYLVTNNKNSIIWGHDFIKTKTPEESYKEFYNKYKRRIIRLYNDIEHNNKICFIYMQNMFGKSLEDKNFKITLTLLQKNLKKLQKKFPNKSIMLIAFQHNKNMKFMQIKYEYNNNCAIYTSNHSYTYKDENGESIITIEKVLQENYHLCGVKEES